MNIGRLSLPLFPTMMSLKNVICFMNLNEYQETALASCLPTAYNETYLIAGLAAETGEVAGKYAKCIRDGTSWENLHKDLQKELGDVLWFVAVLAEYSGISLDEVARINIDKLQSRKERGVLGGSGDNR
jgi:NTP pyrophosphatase (non-canonical NTP hydrolase)